MREITICIRDDDLIMGPMNNKVNGGLSRPVASSSAAKAEPVALKSQATNQPKLPTPKVEVLRNYGNFFLEYTLMNEYALFRKRFLPGVYIIPASSTPLRWFCVLFVRSGLYEGAAFRFELEMSPLYPDGGVPNVTFDPPIFHPLVHHVTGMMDVSCRIPKWSRDENHIHEVVAAVKSLFEAIPEDVKPMNREAFNLYLNNKEEFKRVVEECAGQCLDHMQRESPKSDPNSFDFVAHDINDLSLSLDESSLFSMKMDSSECSTEVNKSPQRLQGLSWMQNGKPWAKEAS